MPIDRTDSPSRRDFIKLGGAALAGATLPSIGLAEKAKDDPYGGFRMGVQTYSLRGFPDFAVAVKKIQAMGLHYCELYPGHVSHEGPMKMKLAESKKLMADAGIQPDAYGVVAFKKDEAAARAVFDFAKDLGLRSISADPSMDSFDTLDKLVEEYKIPIAIHNHGPKHHWGKPEAILAAVKDHHALIGLCCDTGHFLRADVDPVHAIKVLKGRVFGFHIKDFADEKTEASAGDARLKIAELLAEARAQKFDGACSLEYELNPEDPIAGMEKGLANFRKAVASLKA